MKRNTLRNVAVILILAWSANVTFPLLTLAQEEAYPIKLASGKTIMMTESQLKGVLESPGIRFSEEKPKLARGERALSIPGELGGGYIVGTTESLVSALGSVGITVTKVDLTGVGYGLLIPVAVATTVGAVTLVSAVAHR